MTLGTEMTTNMKHTLCFAVRVVSLGVCLSRHSQRLLERTRGKLTPTMNECGGIRRRRGRMRGGQEGRRPRIFWFSRRSNAKSTRTIPDTVPTDPVSSTAETTPSLSIPSEEVTCDTEQVMVSPPPPSPQQRLPSVEESEAPALVSEENERIETSSDESSFESLQTDQVFIQGQQAIMNKIMVDQPQPKPSTKALSSPERKKNPSEPNFNNRTRFDELQAESRLNERLKRFSTDVSIDSKDDFLRYLNDPDVVEEQRRIMDTIRKDSHQFALTERVDPRESTSTTSRSTSDSDQHLSALLSSTNDEILGYMEETASCLSLPPPPRPPDEDLALLQHVRSSSEPMVRGPSTRPSCRRGTSSADAPTTRPRMTHQQETTAQQQQQQQQQNDDKDAQRPYTTQCEQDALVELYQGKKIQVRGTNHTWKKIAKGTATLVQCPVCSTILQVGSNAKLLFCTKCNEVSPICMSNKTSDSSSSSPGMDIRADGLIAVVVQQQEVDVALAMKMARNASNK